MRKRTMSSILLIVGLGLVGIGPWAGPRAADKTAAAEKRSAVGHLITDEGTVLERSGPLGQPWKMVPRKGAVHAGDLLVGLPGAALETDNRAVRLLLLTDMDKRSPYPVLEAAVVLHNTPGCDLDFTLDRGRVDITNIKEKGPARVRIRFHNQTWEATLNEPGARVALQLYGRWPRGVRFTREPGPRDVPAADLLFLVRKGHVDLKHGSCQHAMSAPPGPALMHWDNSGSTDESPEKLDKLPPWTISEESTSERALRIKKVVEELRQEIARSSPEAALETFVTSDNPNHRATGVIYMGALDDLEGLGKVLTGTKYPDAWDRAVVVLRHWIGRCPGQDQIIYRRLVEKRGLKPAQAEGIVQLLHSFGDEELAQPELYRMLVKFLDNDVLGIRGLAYWHLSRLVPEGKAFGYNPLDPKEKRDKARDQWKKLIDKVIAKGELPPRVVVPPKPAAKP